MTTYAHDVGGPAKASAAGCLPAVSAVAAVVVFEADGDAVISSGMLPLMHEFGRVVHLQGVHCHEGRSKLLVELDWASASARAAAFEQIAEWTSVHGVRWRAYSLDHGAQAGVSLRATMRDRIAALADDETRGLEVFFASLARARAAGDAAGVEYFADAVAQVLVPPPPVPDADLSERAERLIESEPGRSVAASIADEERTFFERYQEHKSRSGLNTYRKLAAAAEISVSTVQAIEDQRIKPQFRTIEKLAKAFGVPVSVLLGQ